MGAPSSLASGWRRPPWRTQAAGRGFLHRAQEGVAHPREELRMLVAVDEIGRAAEQLLEGRELGQKFVFDQAGIEPPQQA